MLARTPSVERGSERLAERRRTRRRRGLFVFLLLLLLLLAAIIYGLRQSAVRISHVEVLGADQSLSSYATNAMGGSYFGVIPRDSILFFPESQIRSDILAEHADIAAVSIFRSGLTSISIKTNDRVPVARWCGLAPTAGVEEYCYVFDAGGYIFAAAASTTKTINSFALYAPLVGETLEPPVVSGVEPLRATIAQSEKLPHVFDFARQLLTLGSPVTRIIFRGDEVDDYLENDTRITYVLGREQDALTALVSAQENMNLSDGSVEYVDLRFDGKVYLKKN